MKRSEVNDILRQSISLLNSRNIYLPPFAYWTPDVWTAKGHECDEIRDNMLGWDITDYGKDKFDTLGLVLFTFRNGNQQIKKYVKPYAEKIFILSGNQVSPLHFHWYKMEDIVNRGGGNLIVKLYNHDENNGLANDDVHVSIDGEQIVLPAGGTVRLEPGQSISLTRELYHEIVVEDDNDTVLAGEISKCNDDITDNYYYEPVERFLPIEEDESILYYLCSEYPEAR